MKRSDIRQHIVETASSLFYRNGYNATGINEIIAEAGIAKATLYNHFKSKEDICIAYLRYKNNQFLSDLHAFVETKKPGVSQMLALFDFLIVFFKDRDFNGCWCIRTVAEIPKENDRIRSEIQQQKDDFISFINKIIEANRPELKSVQRKKLARRLYLLYESAVGESHLHQDVWPIKEAKSIGELVMV